jgi:hypothetical protein
MKEIFMLWHTHRFSEHREDEKLIGVFESELAAEQARKSVEGLPGFRNQPEGFEIARTIVGKVYWEEGYATMIGDREVGE